MFFTAIYYGGQTPLPPSPPPSTGSSPTARSHCLYPFFLAPLLFALFDFFLCFGTLFFRRSRLASFTAFLLA